MWAIDGVAAAVDNMIHSLEKLGQLRSKMVDVVEGTAHAVVDVVKSQCFEDEDNGMDAQRLGWAAEHKDKMTSYGSYGSSAMAHEKS
jgi:hypothetical protein